MNEINVEALRALIRLIAPLRALREDVEKALHLEMHAGTGDLVARSLKALRDQVYDITRNGYVAALHVEDDPASGDRERLAQAMIVSGQLLAYLEALTGTAGLHGERRGDYSVQTAPNIHLNMGDMVGGQAERLMDVVNSALRGVPRPPRPPRPPRGPKSKHGGPFGEHEGYPYEEDEL